MSELTIIELDESDNHNQSSYKVKDKELKIKNNEEFLFEIEKDNEEPKNSRSVIQRHSIVYNPLKQANIFE